MIKVNNKHESIIKPDNK